jgi:hypothetical protein
MPVHIILFAVLLLLLLLLPHLHPCSAAVASGGVGCCGGFWHCSWRFVAQSECWQAGDTTSHDRAQKQLCSIYAAFCARAMKGQDVFGGGWLLEH